jgi:hypothetical protein
VCVLRVFRISAHGLVFLWNLAKTENENKCVETIMNQQLKWIYIRSALDVSVGLVRAKIGSMPTLLLWNVWWGYAATSFFFSRMLTSTFFQQRKKLFLVTKTVLLKSIPPRKRRWLKPSLEIRGHVFLASETLLCLQLLLMILLTLSLFGRALITWLLRLAWKKEVAQLDMDLDLFCHWKTLTKFTVSGIMCTMVRFFIWEVRTHPHVDTKAMMRRKKRRGQKKREKQMQPN